MSGFLIVSYLVSTQRLIFLSIPNHLSDLALDGNNQVNDHQHMVLTMSLLGISTFISSVLITGSIFKMIPREQEGRPCVLKNSLLGLEVVSMPHSRDLSR